MLAQRFIMEARADRFFGDDDDRLFKVLVGEFVEGDEHECPTFAGGGGRFYQEVLFATPLVGAFLHGAHSQRIRAGGGAVLGIGDGDGGDGVGDCHKSVSIGKLQAIFPVGWITTAAHNRGNHNPV